MMHTPVAMLRTVRIYYSVGKLPGKTTMTMLMEHNDSSLQNYAVLEGWTVPGDFGWRVISATTRSDALRARH